MSSDDDISEKVEKLIAAINGVRQGGYEEAIQACRGASDALRELLAVQLMPVFADRFASDGSESIERKRETARKVNDDLGSIGLALRCPTTGQASALVAVNKWLSSGGRKGVFRLVSYPRSSDRATFSSTAFPSVDLMPRPVRLEGGRDSWRRHVGPEGANHDKDGQNR